MKQTALNIAPTYVAIFQKYNPEKKDWNFVRLNVHEVCVYFQKYNPEKKDWNFPSTCRSWSGAQSFRSTIQRRRIETRLHTVIVFASQNFQKYNPEKKDWNYR